MTAKRRYTKYLFRNNDRTINDPSLINLRSVYEIVYKNEIKPIPLNYETTARLNRYTPVGIGDIFYANPRENWPLLPPAANQKVAQTAIASSYGLMQMLYTTAVEKMNFVEIGNLPAGKNPSLLLDPETNIHVGTGYLANCIKIVNSRQTTRVNPSSSIKDFRTFIELGFAGYNLGEKHRFSKKSDFNMHYRNLILDRLLKYQIYLNDEIL